MKDKICEQCGKSYQNKDKRSKFCSPSCAATYNNRHRFKDYKVEYNCEICGTPFSTKYAIKKGYRIVCEKCKRKVKTKDIKKTRSILALSKRTVGKIFKRLGIGCSQCGWKECTCDVHHIIPKSKKGTDSHTNLTYLCPNCHRMAHSGSITNFINLEQQIGDKWKEQYNIKLQP